jgi:hypothetical protein
MSLSDPLDQLESIWQDSASTRVLQFGIIQNLQSFNSNNIIKLLIPYV